MMTEQTSRIPSVGCDRCWRAITTDPANPPRVRRFDVEHDGSLAGANLRQAIEEGGNGVAPQ